jgi:Resolvase, N terminal domain
MERPALKRLLEDIKASKIQTVVVYKVDRLTRSLADFAKIVDVLDAHNASFVSVTQQFKTTTSMGRLRISAPDRSALSAISCGSVRSMLPRLIPMSFPDFSSKLTMRAGCC